MASLFVVSGKASGTYFVLGEGVLVVGRDEACEFQIVDELVSRRHMQIRHDDSAESYHVQDLDSANGVFVNGKRISSETELKDADTIKIGDSTLLYTIKSIRDLETAMAFIKKRGEHGKSTLIK
jgi:pSer/pThr/pTyr-binding forkhead associated (FHA) protein